MRAFLGGPQTLRLRLEATDERQVPVAAGAKSVDKALVAADHLEVWWVKPEPGGKATTWQLGVGRLASGEPVVRWFRPKNAGVPLPTASVVEGALEVELPLALLTQAAGPFEVPLTVSYSDSDDAKAGQQSVVSTSKLKWKEPATFGRLLAHEGFRRFPPISSANGVSCEGRRVEEKTDGGPTP